MLDELPSSGVGTSLRDHVIRVWKPMSATSKPVLGIVKKCSKTSHGQRN